MPSSPPLPVPVPVPVLTDAHKRAFVRDGYVVLRRAVPPHLARRAQAFADAAYASAHYSRVGISSAAASTKPPAASFHMRVRQAPEITDLLYRTALFRAVQELVGDGNAVVRNRMAQIAYNDSDRDFVEPAMSPLQPLPSDHWHIDVGAADFAPLASDFFLLAGVALSPGQHLDENRGQYTVWPAVASHFITHRALSEIIFSSPPNEVTAKFLASKPDCGQPKRLLLRPGDAFIAHQRLAHSPGINLSDVVRKNVYFRVLHKRNQHFIYQRLKSPTPWVGFQGLEKLLPTGATSYTETNDNEKLIRGLLRTAPMGSKLSPRKRTILTLSAPQKSSFIRDGYLVLRGLVDNDIIQPALESIDDAIEKNQFQVYPEVDTGSRVPAVAFRRSTCRSPEITNLFLKTGLVDLCQQFLGEGNVVLSRNRGNISINGLNEFYSPKNMSLASAHPKDEWAMDIPLEEYAKLGTDCLLLVGVALSPGQELNENRGQVVVWPGSHIETHQHLRALRSKNASTEEMHPRTWSANTAGGEPTRLLLRPGDVFILHQRLAHAAGINLTKVMRKNVLFRVTHTDFDEIVADYVHDEVPFVGFQGLSDLLEKNEKAQLK